ncbi:hypothetical protein COE20_09085 [Bacillus cereus]|uniref:hypothetical protein n=1 Tax=Bacillus cereus TaxID=1396 RepID=UPI000BED4C38|nr:hypothetical protein [Bacillus cereus]PDZ06607.1 hypothetical protein CON03_06880 [Bacillus cereus]PFN11542.1 hypothetical protein COJ72_31530 [Bacillus cereus]PGY29246.1 hypothetical protein COE20_09085 [Bacillus cereus]
MTVQQEKVTKQVLCRKCKSNQIVGNRRGYNFRRVFSFLFFLFALILFSALLPNEYYEISQGIILISVILGFPATIISGLVGRKNIVNGCMNCGHTWMPKK